MGIGWRLLNVVQGIVLVVWSAVCIPAAVLMRVVTGSTRLPLAMARRVWAPGVLMLGGARVRVTGRDRLDLASAYLFAGNHQSFHDIPALFVALPVELRFVARRSLRKVPFLGWYMEAMGMVFVERSRRLGTVRAVSDAKEVLASGASLVTFPEGTRTSDGSVGEFKSASLVPAIQTGVPIVPVAIEGAFEMLPRGGFKPRPGTIRVTFGEPIETRGLAESDRRTLAREVRERVLAIVNSSRPPAG